MIEFIRYLKGYVLIKVWGFAPERFFNLCAGKNILLWNIRKEADAYYMCISLSGFKSLRKIARKTKTRVVIKKRFGLPFLMPRLLKRKAFLFGLCLACFFWFVSTRFVWEISITGNNSLTDDRFTAFLQEEGIFVGCRKKNVDIESLEKEARKTFPEITWISAKFSGTELAISVKEADGGSQSAREEGFADLYAEKEGTIVSMVVRSGVPMVKIGDRVEVGTLLVSGEVPVYNDDETIRKYRETYADADIVIRRKENIYETLSFVREKKVYTGREKKKYVFRFFGKEILLGKEGGFPYYTMVEETKDVSIMKGFSLPVSFGQKVYREYLPTESMYTLKEAKSLLSEKYKRILQGLSEKGITVLEKQVKMDSEEGKWILTGELTVEEKIGVQIER